jgi:hypothetical protein
MPSSACKIRLWPVIPERESALMQQFSVSIPTEPIGSIPRPLDLIERVAKGDSEDPDLVPLYEATIRDTIERLEAIGSPVVTDGEQRSITISR